ncbi:hypothetical protein CL659_02850, partial [bacterium]|nr:hypothetical protein [bacterium]
MNKNIIFFILLTLGSCQDSNNQNNSEYHLSLINPTWESHISEIFTEHCVTCHSDGNVADFSLETYDQVKDK